MLDTQLSVAAFTAMGIIHFVAMIIFFIATIILLSKKQQLGTILMFIGALGSLLTAIIEKVFNQFGQYFLGTDSFMNVYYLPFLVSAILYFMIGVGLLIFAVSLRKDNSVRSE